ncbi:MAG: hypothetical protein WCP46_07650 [Alphaproteobacteria bacterium]
MKNILKILSVASLFFGENFVYACCMDDDDFKEVMRQETEYSARIRGALRGSSVAPSVPDDDRKDSPLPHSAEKSEVLISCVRTGDFKPYFSFLKKEVTEDINSMYKDCSKVAFLCSLRRFVTGLQISDFEYIARPRVAGDVVPFGLRLESVLRERVATFITDGV